MSSRVRSAHWRNQKIARLPARRRAQVKARAAELIAEELSLQDLRKTLNRAQAQLARTLNVGQDTVSRYEQRTDMLLSTLQEYVQATASGTHVSASCCRSTAWIL